MKSVFEFVEFYKQHNFRPIPIYPLEAGCQCKIRTGKECEDNQCLGKVPGVRHWADRDDYEFNETDNVGLAMGLQPNGKWLLGFDVDGQLDLNKYFYDLPETLQCKTARGMHYIYQVQPNAPFGNWNDLLKTRSDTGYKVGHNGALDLRYCRGILTSPPSMMKNDQRMEWDNWREPAVLSPYTQTLITMKHKRTYPHIKHYPLWTMHPSHKGKKP